MIPSPVRALKEGTGSAILPTAQSSQKIAFFWRAARCFHGVTWRRVGLVTLFCAIYGILLSVDLGGVPRSGAAYLAGFATALEVLLPVFLAVTVMANFAPQRQVSRAVALALTVVVAAAIGYWFLTLTRRTDAFGHAASAIPFVMVGWLGVAIHLLHERDDAAEQALHNEAEYQLELDRQMSEAQLQVLQSQIEPHFLFNTLAHVRRLYQTDPGAGRAMMRHLSRYLGAALPAMRESGIGLGQDLDLAVAYLNVQQIRMGSRLAFEIDVPRELSEVLVPPMTITTLVENAIKHGLSPLPEGGTVRIRARTVGHAFSVEVSDSGQGFQTSLGAGVGLANIRARLATLYGTAAQLSLSQNEPRGVTAKVVAPMSVRGFAPG